MNSLQFVDNIRALQSLLSSQVKTDNCRRLIACRVHAADQAIASMRRFARRKPDTRVAFQCTHIADRWQDMLDNVIANQ